jgi:arsenate reductase
VSDKVFHVLFLSQRNSARSMMAEAILNRIGQPHFVAYSAGIDPVGDLELETRELFEAMGYPANNLHPKHYRDFGTADALKLDFVFTLSDTAAGEPLPEWPGLPVSAHWASPDPVKAMGEPWERKQAFSRAMAELDRRLKIFVNLPLASLDRLSIQSHVDEIGQSKGEE